MILTCPNCATRYLAPDTAIGGGRQVRCDACGTEWLAAGEGVAPTAPAPRAPLTEEPADAPATNFDLPVETPLFAARPAPAKRGVSGVWLALAGAVLALAAALLLFRSDIVRQWPTAAGAYAAVGVRAGS